ncbi:MAG: hypothetical protein ACRCTY_08690, partial [Candidatus Adiutrix sp.]
MDKLIKNTLATSHLGVSCLETGALGPLSLQNLIERLSKLDYSQMYLDDFLLTWEKTDHEINAVFLVADILRGLREVNISARFFDSGLGVSLFRDNSTRTRFSFVSACNLLGLTAQ